MSELPAALQDACEKDARRPGTCVCGNCSDDAVLNTCLRYSKGSGDAWVLASCLPGKDCTAKFPLGSARRKGDVIVSCPCKDRVPVNHCAPVAPPRRACPPPTLPPHGFLHLLREGIFWWGIASLLVLLGWGVKKILDHRKGTIPASLLPPVGPDLPPLPPDVMPPPGEPPAPPEGAGY